MSRPSEDDRDAVDRAFADLVAGYHLTAARPDPPTDPPSSVEAQATASDQQRGPDNTWADEHPLFHFSDPVVAPEESEPQEERFVPEPPMPLGRPAWPVLVAWLAMGYAVLAVLATALGVRLPVWASWLAVAGFVGGFALLVARLPRHRPPDAGNGAVL